MHSLPQTNEQSKIDIAFLKTLTGTEAETRQVSALLNTELWRLIATSTKQTIKPYNPIMLKALYRYVSKSIAQICTMLKPSKGLEFDAVEKQFHQRTEQLAELLRQCGATADASIEIALRALLHRPDFDIMAPEFAHVRYALKQKARTAQNYTEYQVAPVQTYQGESLYGHLYTSYYV